MPKILEAKLKSEYGAKSKVPYKIMNAKGYMKGPNETPKGAQVERKLETEGYAYDFRKRQGGRPKKNGS